MSEALSKTLHGDFDSVFHEVTQPEKVAWTTEGQLRLFHLNIRNNKFNPEEMKTLLYRNIGEYVFSRARIERFKVTGDAFAVGAQAIRVELSTDAKQYASTCDGIHLLTSKTSGLPYHQVVFGASSIVGELTYAIDAAFDSILEIENNEDKELHMVDNVIFDRLLNEDEVELAKEIFLPSPNKTTSYNTSYGVFLGYTIGLDPTKYSVAEFPQIVEEKMQEDIRRNIDYILKKINDNFLGQHSFYFYVLPFNDAEDEKKAIMEAVMKGDVDL